MKIRRYILMLFLPFLIMCSLNKDRPGFYAMDTATGDASLETQAAMLKQLGYDGTCYTVGLQEKGWSDIPEMQNALENQGLSLFAVYFALEVDEPLSALPSPIMDMIKELNGTSTLLWVTLRSKHLPPSSTDNDSIAVAALSLLSDRAQAAGLSVSLYPHINFYAQSLEDVLRLAKLADRDNIGVTFNLCHWLRVEKGADPRPALESAIHHINMITLNGADQVKGQALGWDRLIQPLGQGSFDVSSLVHWLLDKGYDGPFAFQGYGIKQNPEQVLAQTMSSWNQIFEH